jgi:hypothetical protein
MTPGAADIATATRQAALNALERYAADAGEAMLANFDRVRDSVAAHLDDYVLGSLELVRTVDTTARTMTITVRVEVNAARLANIMKSTSAVGTTSQSQRSLIGMFVMAREAAAVEQFGAEQRRSAQVQGSAHSALRSDSSGANRETDSLKGGSVALRDSVSRSSQRSSAFAADTAIRRSESVVQRADKVTYAVSQAEDLNLALSSALSGSGFEVVESAFLDDGATPDLVDAVRTDFGRGDDLGPATLRRLANAGKAAGVSYVLVGTVDVGAQTRDDVTGGIKIFAKVTGKVLDLRNRLPRTAASVDPAQYAGVGPTAAVARLNALRAAADAIGREVVARLNAADVR